MDTTNEGPLLVVALMMRVLFGLALGGVDKRLLIRAIHRVNPGASLDLSAVVKAMKEYSLQKKYAWCRLFDSYESSMRRVEDLVCCASLGA